LLDKVGNDDYSEWTVYGNCVNAAKRLQSLDAPASLDHRNILAAGAILAEHSQFATELREWIRLSPALGPLNFLNPAHYERPLKGVGACAFVHTAIEAKPECL